MNIRFHHLALAAMGTTGAQAFSPQSPPSFAHRTLSLQAVATIGPPTNSILTSNVNQNAEFPSPLGPMDRFKRAGKFWATSVPIVADYYGLMSRIKLKETLTGHALEESEMERLWHDQHADGATKMKNTINDLKGFYVKAAQIVGARADLFPSEYTEALMSFQENVDPMPTSLARAVVEKELLTDGQTFEDVFSEFDEIPLGSASVAQVHRAVLTEAYGGKEVAVKIQRPSIEAKLMGDIKNLLAISKAFRNNPNLPLDYYTIFSELEKQLENEFDFMLEAESMERIYKSLIIGPDGSPRDIPLVMPLPVEGLVTKRVLVMDYLEGTPLTRATEKMKEKGIKPDSPEAKLFATRLLNALTTVFGRNILEAGYFHADPHPGNIFILDDGRIGLIDFGQVKEISNEYRDTLNKMMIALDDRRNDGLEGSTGINDERVRDLTLELGIELKATAPDVAATAMGIWLFDGSSDLPGGYEKGELSEKSPSKALKTFPQELVLVARSSMLIKGFANRFGIPWSLAKEWAPVARQMLGESEVTMAAPQKRGRMGRMWGFVKKFTKGRTARLAQRLPAPMRRGVASLALKFQ
ncbi:protein kinase UbiB [Seminavis robusta]|uniref:Protein kinase UbiB n=1 Tax=Seminavis robusta TaxID=568900 RepID=A0A9N8DQG2_9STRA|nr:protein kinase UbiB [Seminavis robusta]|eukprot:Sro298_g111200.1 protein kinase UbiB (583) ;mRNA; f:63531-65279